jgi:hypothetical protein
MFVSSTTRIAYGFVRPSWSSFRMFLAGCLHRFIDKSFDLLWWHVGEAFPGLLNSFIEQAPLDGILDEFRQCALLRP